MFDESMMGGGPGNQFSKVLCSVPCIKTNSNNMFDNSMIGGGRQPVFKRPLFNDFC